MRSVRVFEYRFVTRAGVKVEDVVITDVKHARAVRKRLLRNAKRFGRRLGPHANHRILVKRPVI